MSAATRLRVLAEQAESHPESRGPEAQAAWAVVQKAEDWLDDNSVDLARLLADALDVVHRYYCDAPHIEGCNIDRDTPCDCGRDEWDRLHDDLMARADQLTPGAP